MTPQQSLNQTTRRRPRIAGERGRATGPPQVAEPVDPVQRGRADPVQRGRVDLVKRNAARRAPKDGPRATLSRTIITAVLVPLALVTAAAVVLAAVVGYQAWQRHQIAGNADPATSAAQSAATTLLSWNYQHLDSERAADQRLLTPAYAKKFDATWDQTVAKVAPASKSVVTNKVLASSVLPCGDQCSTDQVQVFMFMDQTNTSPNQQVAGVEQNRVVFTMSKVGGSWLVDAISPL
ncbi:MAG: hypothetical protein ACRDP1_00160 [Nocardioidaceae bacterium]